MLYFQTKPDQVFEAVLHETLETEMKEISRISGNKDLNAWIAGYAQISLAFTPYTATVTLEQLFSASREPTVYRLTDYHWLLVYECLKNYCAIHNDIIRDEQTRGLCIGLNHVGEIDFDQLTELYFWDSDFLFVFGSQEGFRETATFQCEEVESNPDLTVDIGPLPTQLTLTPVEDPAWRVPDPNEYVGPEWIRYPDFRQDVDHLCHNDS